MGDHMVVELLCKKQFNMCKLWENETLCDVTLHAGNKSIKCHRNVLACSSPYFQAMFTSPLAESQKADIFIGDIDAVTLEEVIKFIYTTQIELNPLNVQTFLQAASIFHLDCLGKKCSDFMLSQILPSNSIGVTEIARQFGYFELAKKADMFTKFNFREVILEDEFLTLSANHLQEIISDDELFVNNEVEVYENVMAWVKHDPGNRKGFLPYLLEKVHLPLLPTEYLRTYVESDSLVRTDLKCRDLLDEARNYRLWQAQHLPIPHFPVSERTQPRLCCAGIVLCVGGNGIRGIPCSTIEAYSPYFKKWRKMKIPEITTTKRHVECIFAEGKVYAVGGCDINGRHLATAEVFDLVTSRWLQLKPMLMKRKGLGLCALGNSIYAVGGLDDRRFYSFVERYDVQANEWYPVQSMYSQRGGVAVVKVKDKMFAIGGVNPLRVLNTCEVYDLNLNKWEFVSPMKQSRVGAAAAVVNGFIYVLGGFDQEKPLNSVERYDPDNDVWSFVSPMKLSRGGVGATALGGFIYAIGGHNGRRYLNYVEIYDVMQDSWKMGPVLSEHKAGARVTACSILPENMKNIFQEH